MRRIVIAALLGAAAVATPAVAAESGPVLGSFGVDLSGMDASVRPGDDFFAYVNGTWARDTEIPADRASWGMFDQLRLLSQERTRAILEEAANDANASGNARKFGDFYASLMDEAAIERAGLEPLQADFAAIAAIQTRQQLSDAIAANVRNLGPTPFNLGISQDLRDPAKMTASLGQGGLGMPNRDYYLEARHAPQKAAYQAHIARMLVLAGVKEDVAAADAARILALETDIARAHWTNVETRQADKRYNPIAVDQLPTYYPGVEWASWRTITGVAAEPSLNIAQPSALQGIAGLIGSAPIADWQAWLFYHTLRHAAQLLPEAFRDEHFAFYGATLSGTPQQQERWKQASDLTSAALGEAIGEIYVARHFPPEAKAQMDELVRNIIAAMDVRLQKLEWMAPATKAAARAKLARFTPKIGYPDQWRDYTALEVVRGDPVGNARRLIAFEHARNVAKLGKPVDRSEWFMTPMTVNAYANPLWNEIVFPAAILQAPFFDPNADPAVNYGGIGAVIGHEITHHFDDQGRKYDPDGKLSDWWTAEDVTRFTALTDRLVKQVEAYEPLPGKHINGRLSLGENIADIAGLNIAWDAWQRSLGGQTPPVVDGRTGAERFYLGFGQIWRSKYRDAALDRQLTVGPHSPSHYRPQTVRNHDNWYETFDVQPGQKLYLLPDERVRIW